MDRKLVLNLMLIVFVLSTFNVVQAQTKKLFVYYPTWAAPTMKPADLKFPSGMETIYMHFSAHISETSPFFGPVVSSADSSDLANMQKAFIDTCHNAGQKVLLSITAQGGHGTTLKNVSNNATQRKAFVSSVSSYCKRKGYDGIDLDWESDIDSAAVTRLIKEFRDTLNTWTTPGMLTMATHSDPFIYPGIWGFYNTATMNAYLDAFFGMNYVMSTNERSWGSLGNSNNVWRCMFDSPYSRPTSAPWSGFAGGYWSQDFKTNTLVPWLANGATREKVGIGLWNGGTTMLNSSSSSVPGSSLVYGTPGYATYSQVLSGTSNYVQEADHYWGIVGGLYCSWIDSVGAYKRTKWAKDTMQTNIFMLYDAYSGFLPTGQRYGRQPHFDAMVNAIRSTQAPVPTGSLTATPNSLPIGGGNTTLSWTSGNALSASIDQGIGAVALNGSLNIPVSSTRTFNLTLTNANGSQVYSVTVTVATPAASGSLTAVPSSLPAGGGNVTLTWTSSNATSASINQGIGTVQLNSSTSVFVPSSRTFILTLTNANGSVTYSAPVTVAGSSSQQLSVYSDNALPSPWTTDGSWGGSSDFASTEQVYSGSTSIKGTYTSGWSALFLRSGSWGSPQPVNPSGYDTLRFAIRGSGSPITMYTSLGDASGEFATQYSYTVPASAWLPVAIPVASLNPGNNPFLTVSFHVHQSAGSVFYLDEVRFAGQSAEPPAAPPFVFPSSNATGVPSSFAMLWSKPAGATRYHLQLASDSLFASLVVNDSSLTDTSRSVSSLASGTKFWRRVRANGVGGWSGFGSSSSFTTAVVLPTGTFSIDPDSLPSGGGTVTLSWTSSNATSASINNGIGSVSVSGSRIATVGATTSFTLTLTNPGGSQQYHAGVFVALPGGQGQQDITSQGTPIALITNPTGGGNHDIEVIRDGVIPPQGGTNALEQYDTYTDGSSRSFDWIGYQFSTSRSFSSVLYQEGLDNQWGGCFVTLRVQVRSGGVWTDVQGFSSSPSYAGANAVSYETYELTFNPVTGDAIRIAGAPTGSGHYLGAAELRVFEQQSGSLPSSPQLISPANGAVAQPVSLVLRWGLVANVVGYHLQVSTDSLFSSTVVDDVQLTDTVRQVSGLASSTKYFWRISSRSASGEGSYSSPWNFVTLQGAPAAPVQTLPTNNAANQSLSPTLRWNSSSGATHYHVQVSRDSSFSILVVNDSIVINKYRKVTGLANLTKYFWRVRAKNAAGFGAFSAKWSFTTKKGRTDVTPNATSISLITQPNGQGNPNREIIRDNVTPPIGNTNPLDQFDTFTGNFRQDDWIGYTFPIAHSFSNIEFQEGVESDSGGWFASLNVQVRVNGNWIDVQNFTSIPVYEPNNGVSFESYELNFDPIVGDGVRIVGVPGGTYTYISVAELRVMDDDTTTTNVHGMQSVPDKHVLDQNYPNPFNPATRISFFVQEQGHVTLTVYNVLGQRVATLIDGMMPAGKQTVEFSGHGFADGVYMYVFATGNFTDMKKMVLLK